MKQQKQASISCSGHARAYLDGKPIHVTVILVVVALTAPIM